MVPSSLTSRSRPGRQSSSPSPSSGGSLLSGTGVPTGACTGDAYIDLTTGEIYHCVLEKWTDTGDCSAAPYPEIDLAGCGLKDAHLAAAHLAAAHLATADLEGAYLQQARLTSANLYGANLNDAELAGADLTGVSSSITTCPDDTNSDNDGGTCSGHLS